MLNTKMLRGFVSRVLGVNNYVMTQTKSLSTVAMAGLRSSPPCSHVPYRHSVASSPMPITSPQRSLLDRITSQVPALYLMCTRHNYRSYKPNALKRIRKHGLEKRLSCQSQREILMRRFIKGKWRLSVFDRFLNELPEKKLKKSQRINLFDPKKGYKKFIKDVEYYKFQ